MSFAHVHYRLCGEPNGNNTSERGDDGLPQFPTKGVLHENRHLKHAGEKKQPRAGEINILVAFFMLRDVNHCSVGHAVPPGFLQMH